MEDESIGRAIVNGSSDFYLNVYPKTALSLSRDWNTYENLRCHWVYQHRCLRRM